MESARMSYSLFTFLLEGQYEIDAYDASQYPSQIVAAGSYQRSVSPPPLCINPREIDPGFGLPKTQEEWTYPLSPDDLSDPEPAESESSSSRASSATPSLASDVENAPTSPPPRPAKKKPTIRAHFPRKKKTNPKVGGWGTDLKLCAFCETTVQERQMQRHILHKHPKPGQSVPASVRTCGRCKQVFSRIDAMKRHRRKCMA